MFFFMFMSPAVIWTIVIIAAAAVAAYFIFRPKKKSKRKKKMNENIFAEGLCDNITVFAELLEPTYLLSVGNTRRKDDIFTAWALKMKAAEVSPEFEAIFAKKIGAASKGKAKDKKYIKAAEKLTKAIFNAGVIRSSEITAVANEETLKKYDVVGKYALEEGLTYDVIVPYWYADEDIVCKGALKQ